MFTLHRTLPRLRVAVAAVFVAGAAVVVTGSPAAADCVPRSDYAEYPASGQGGGGLHPEGYVDHAGYKCVDGAWVHEATAEVDKDLGGSFQG
ncbi:hypothetical protein [Nonomuraea gerenzanensis]|uniref:hypothetical protein n=1 Tax=Nonomuraea gerenzanensis TaxID=93944 RepID=UPI001CD9A26A|nr:hypothetical protein [Nonomuraea gerenzanensis]UBU08380.1 hypothetical protein LCN96_28720 [Nonomuraea gerenzanensis]